MGSRGRTAALLRYNGWRLLVFAVVAGLGYLAGLRGALLLAVALVVSGVLSYFLLYRQRAALAEVVAQAVEAGRGRLAARTAREDAAAEEWHAGDREPAGAPKD